LLDDLTKSFGSLFAHPL